MPQLPTPGRGPGSMKLNAAGRGSMRFHAATATATATAATAAGARGHLLQKQVHAGQAAHRTSLGSRPLSAGTPRQQEHWLSDFWPQRTLYPGAVATSATAHAVEARERAEPKTSRSQRSSLDVQRDVPLPDEPTTPAQRRESPFDAATSSSDSADTDAVAPEASATDSSSNATAAEPAAAEQPQAASSPDSNAASPAGFSRSNPGNVLISVLMPTALSGWLIGPKGATARANQVEGARWWLSDRSWGSLGGAQNLRMLNIQGRPEVVSVALEKILGVIFADGAPANKSYFKTRGGQYKAKILVQTWLVGSLLGKGGAKIQEMQAATNSRMQVVPMERLLTPLQPTQARAPKVEGPEAVLEIASPSVADLVSAVHLAFAAVAANPKYKPLMRKSLTDYPTQLTGQPQTAATPDVVATAA